MLGDTHFHDLSVAARQLRKRRLLRPQKNSAAGMHSHDLPVFLVNPTRLPELAEEPAPERDFRGKLAELYAQSAAALAPSAEAAKAHLMAVRTRLYDLGDLWQRQNVREKTAKLALAALLAPLAFLFTLDRPQHGLKIAEATAPQKPAPIFELDQRLAFAQNLRDKLLSNAITLAMNAPPPPLSLLLKGGDANHPPTEGGQLEAPTPDGASDSQAASGMIVPLLSPDDGAKWTFPFASQPYVVGDLPRSPESSFRAEFAMSDTMNGASERASVVQLDDAVIAPIPKAKQNKLTKAKKVATRKRRPPLSNQMTAAASQQPASNAGQPNLPPPPILFFLGAPPPPAAQPIQALPAPPPAAKAPPVSPPASKPWAPNSLSDIFKNNY